MPSLSRKSQFFILTAVVIVGVFYALSRNINPFSFIDTSSPAQGDEIFFFNNVKEKAVKTVEISSPDELITNLATYKNFVQGVARDKEYILVFDYTVTDTDVDFSMTLTSKRMTLKSDFTVQRP